MVLIMNSQRLFSRILCKHNLATTIKYYQADKLGIPLISLRKFSEKFDSKIPSLREKPPIVDQKSSVWQKRIKSIEIIGGLGFIFTIGYAIKKSEVFTGRGLVKVKEDKEREKAAAYEAAKMLEEFDEDEVRIFPDVELPESIPYLLIGGGTASLAAFRAIKSRDPTAKVLIISGEGENPYKRPPLSKEFWFTDEPEITKKLSYKGWSGTERSVYFEHAEYYQSIDTLLANEDGGLAVVYGKKAVKIDATNKRVYLDNGKEITYEKCLIATGGKPKSLSVFVNAEESVKSKVTLFRSIADFKRLYKAMERGKRIAVIGGGFLGTELAIAVGRNSPQEEDPVVQIYPESGNMAKVLPEYMSQWSTNVVKKSRVKIISNSYVKSATPVPGGKVKLVLNTDEEVVVDRVVVAVGLEPNIDLALSSGLEVDENQGGFRVNAELEARSNLWVAGDAACFYDVKLGRRRVEHHDHAVVSGRLAGENMTGAGHPYWHQSMFWSDFGPEVGYEAIGLVDSALPTVGVFAKATEKDTPKAVDEASGDDLRSEAEQTVDPTPESVFESSTQHIPVEGEDYRKGVIFYLRNEIVVGILMLNVFNKMPIARRILKEAKVYDDLNEVAKLFNLHEPENIEVD